MWIKSVAPCHSVSVTQLEWFDEDHKFVIGYGDGLVVLANRNQFDEPVRIKAHKASGFVLKFQFFSCMHSKP